MPHITSANVACGFHGGDPHVMRKAAAQAVRMAMEGKVKTIDGVDVDISVQTICCHGDTPGAQNIVKAVRAALEKAGCQVRPLRDWLPKPRRRAPRDARVGR